MSTSRNRSDTVDTAGTLTSVEKARLLEEMPSYDPEDDDNDDDHGHKDGRADVDKERDNANTAGGSSKGSAGGNKGGGDWQPARKRRKTGRDSLDGTTLVAAAAGEDTTEHDDIDAVAAAGAANKVDPTGADEALSAAAAAAAADKATLHAAKARLSKWAQRLFDPDRPRGIVETPEIIPLNDEFLTAFGRREREMDEQAAKMKKKNGGGDNEGDNLDANDDSDDDDSTKLPSTTTATTAKKKCKIKITNLAYTTTSRTIISTFASYGDVVAVHLVPDPSNPYQSLGRGYVTYNEAEEAQRAVEEMDGKRLDGRLLRIGIAADRPGGSTRKRRRSMDDNGGGGADGGGNGVGADLLAGDAGGRGGGGPGASKPSDRYWDKDISTKCFNCGEVGHRSDSCPNPTKVPPCNLCGNVTVADGTAQGPHDSWSCPFKAICFNCGVPGHVARDCPENRGGRNGRGAPPPRRVVCGRCYRSGHHRWQCRENAQRVSQHEAQCQIPTCGRRGHFACRKMGWFFGLRGTYCFNCGRKGHHGMGCDRPKLDDCARNPELAEDEIDEAGLESLHEEMDERSSSHRGGRSDDRERGRDRGRDRDRERGRDRSRDRSGSIERHGGGGGRSRAKSQPPPREAGRYNEGRRRSSGGGGSGGSRGGGGGGGGGRNQQRGYGGGGGGRRGYR